MTIFLVSGIFKHRVSWIHVFDIVLNRVPERGPHTLGEWRKRKRKHSPREAWRGPRKNDRNPRLAPGEALRGAPEAPEAPDRTQGSPREAAERPQAPQSGLRNPGIDEHNFVSAHD